MVSDAEMESESVESVIRERQEISEAVISRLIETGRGIAFIKLEEYLSIPDLREYICDRLGEDKIPETIAIVPDIPAVEGEITEDAAASLLAPVNVFKYTLTRPVGSTEISLTELWRQILRRKIISTEDNFIDLGGDSGMAAVLLEMIREDFGVDVPLDVFFRELTIRDLATVIDDIKKLAS